MDRLQVYLLAVQVSRNDSFTHICICYQVVEFGTSGSVAAKLTTILVENSSSLLLD